MPGYADRLQVAETYIVAGAWLLFALIFLLRRRPARPAEITRDRRSVVGLVVQLAGYAMVRLGLRAPGATFLPFGPMVELICAVSAAGVLVASVYLTYAAMRTLGKQWSLAARLVQEHQLVTAGPYGLVRHPIYTAMFGMLVGTAMAISGWPELLLGMAVFLMGTELRIQAEEQLLSGAFGDAYREYARKVPALIPWSR
jgi:protein-S-isoprenylcysteine O-methyltransferase Ste14